MKQNKTVLPTYSSVKIKIIIHTSTRQSFTALALFKAEQTLVVVNAQTLPIFIKIAQNKGNQESVSNFYWQFMHNKTHFDSKCNIYSIKHVFNTEISPNLKSLKNNNWFWLNFKSATAPPESQAKKLLIVSQCRTVTSTFTPPSRPSHCGTGKLLVYDIFPPATAIIDYAMGLQKLSANKQFSLVFKWQ